mgnify:CR=1 FL=1
MYTIFTQISFNTIHSIIGWFWLFLRLMEHDAHTHYQNQIVSTIRTDLDNTHTHIQGQSFQYFSLFIIVVFSSFSSWFYHYHHPMEYGMFVNMTVSNTAKKDIHPPQRFSIIIFTIVHHVIEFILKVSRVVWKDVIHSDDDYDYYISIWLNQKEKTITTLFVEWCHIVF